MATFSGTNGNDTINAATGQIVGFTPNTPADVLLLQDSIGDTINAGNGGSDFIASGDGSDVINDSLGHVRHDRLRPRQRYDQHHQRPDLRLDRRRRRHGYPGRRSARTCRS